MPCTFDVFISHIPNYQTSMDFFYLPIYVFSALLLWQYVALRLDKLTKYKIVRPTIVIHYVTNHLKWVWFHIGRFFAYVSSFYIYLGFEDFIYALAQILSSIWSLLTSFFDFIQGYISVYPLYQKPHLLIWGSTTLVVTTTAGVFWYFDCYDVIYSISQDPTILLEWGKNNVKCLFSTFVAILACGTAYALTWTPKREQDQIVEKAQRKIK